jgi:hypothetical protein
MLKTNPLYVETLIECTLDDIWKHTQEPDVHQKWDLRFSEIMYLPKENNDAKQQFHYRTNVGFGLGVSGKGESVGTKSKSNGESTSVLKFWSDHTLSLITTGSGYWKYIPQAGGIKFLTGYDYKVRWGIIGKIIDKLIFRPLISWATAWSFDALKLWIEQKIDPKYSISRYITYLFAKLTLVFIWVYMGLIPKIICKDSGELDMIKGIRLFEGIEVIVINAVGVLEILFGLALLLIGRKKWLHYINIGALGILTSIGIFANPQSAVAPFNPVTITVAMIALSLIILVNLDNLPNAGNCIRKANKNK